MVKIYKISNKNTYKYLIQQDLISSKAKNQISDTFLRFVNVVRSKPV